MPFHYPTATPLRSNKEFNGIISQVKRELQVAKKDLQKTADELQVSKTDLQKTADELQVAKWHPSNNKEEAKAWKSACDEAKCVIQTDNVVIKRMQVSDWHGSLLHVSALPFL